MMKIQLDEIEKILSTLLLKYKETVGNEIEINSDFYWDFSSTEIYNPNKEPKDLSLGQLTDDLRTLKTSLISDDLIPYDLQRVANILKALSIEKPIFM